MVMLALLAVAGCEVEDLGGGGTAYAGVFDDAGGLAPGGRVYVAGVRVGRIQSVTLEGDKAKVGITLDSDAPAVHSDACLAVGWYGVGNGAHVTLEPGKAGDLESGSTIACTRSGSDLADTTERAAENAGKLLEEAVSGKGVVAMLLRDEAFAAKVLAFFSAPPALPPPPAPAPDDEPSDEPAPAPKAPAPKAPAPAPKPKAPPKTDLVSPF